MKLLVPKELDASEARAAMVPEVAKKLIDLGAVLEVEAGIGQSILCSDEEYEKAGAVIVTDRASAMKDADIILRLSAPAEDEIELMKEGSISVSYLDPFRNPKLLKKFAECKVSAVCMEMIPRTTLAQKMDALSSQANLAGYVAVIMASERLPKMLPMMMTPAGTISPAKVFIIGAGVAGLQAIATAKRLGARVEAFDTRPVVEEQVQSLGARFVKVDLGETGQTKDGYAKQLTEEQLGLQRDAMAKVCASSDIVITTAQIFGRKAPVIVTKDMLKGMKPGSVVVDMAADTGGNVEGTVLGEEVDVDGVKVIGLANLPSMVPVNASQMYASNLGSLITHFWDKEEKVFKLDMEDEIIQGCLISHAGEITNDALKKLAEEENGE